MLAYAAGRPRIGARRSSPNTLLFIISAHIAAVAAIMSAKMDLPKDLFDKPTVIRFIPVRPPPPATDAKPQRTQQQHPIYAPAPPTPIPAPPIQSPDTTPRIPSSGETGETPTPPQPPVDIRPQPVPVSTPAQPLTAASDLRPPYPESKLLAGEEAALTLRLSIDENGRVVGVDPIGRADPVFLSAARRHLMSHWRYKPAMEGGRAAASTVVVTLRFELDG